MNTEQNIVISHDDIQIMIDKLNKKRESGRMRAQKWYDSHKDDLQQQRLTKKKERQDLKNTVVEKMEPKKRGCKVKPINVSDIINGLIKI